MTPQHLINGASPLMTWLDQYTLLVHKFTKQPSLPCSSNDWCWLKVPWHFLKETFVLMASFWQVIIVCLLVEIIPAFCVHLIIHETFLLILTDGTTTFAQNGIISNGIISNVFLLWCLICSVTFMIQPTLNPNTDFPWQRIALPGPWITFSEVTFVKLCKSKIKFGAPSFGQLESSSTHQKWFPVTSGLYYKCFTIVIYSRKLCFSLEHNLQS